MREREESGPSCLRCGYCLTGLQPAGLCPECGARYDRTRPPGVLVCPAWGWVSLVAPPLMLVGFLSLPSLILHLSGSDGPGIVGRCLGGMWIVGWIGCFVWARKVCTRVADRACAYREEQALAGHVPQPTEEERIALRDGLYAIEFLILLATPPVLAVGSLILLSYLS
jgi:hypothetical protein